MFSINITGGLPIYEQLYNRVTQLIVTGIMTENEKLPPVREVAKELGINPNTVQKTYQKLEAEGLIYSIPAKGSYVAHYDTAKKVIREKAVARFKEAANEAILSGAEKKDLIEIIEQIEGGNDNDQHRKSS